MQQTTETRHCLECGLEIPAGEASDRCPHCLLRLALGERADNLLSSRPRYFGSYQLLEEIARGGMGVVWKARQLGVNRLVALKMIPAGQLASPQARLRFRIETESVAKLDHPHIVSLYETGEHDGQHYFSMKLMEGGNLAEWISSNRRPEAERSSVCSQKSGNDQSPLASAATHKEWLHRAAHLVTTIARAVHHAHQRGLLHRDLKPSNILMDDRGEPHVADFGLAKVLGHDTGFTQTEAVLGSPNYMAPEQASGQAAQLTVAADVYSLGAILYELLTGRPPFQAATAVETMRQVVDTEVVSARQFNPTVDPDLETVCLKCLQKHPAARYGSAEELATDLERWLERRPIQARPIGRLEQLHRWCRRQPALATALGLSALLLAALVIGTAMAAVRIGRAERKAVAHLRESLLDQARMLRINAAMGMRNEGLRLIREALSLGGSPEFRRRARDELLAVLALTDLEFAGQPQLPPAPDTALALMDPQMERYASIVNETNLVLRRTGDGTQLRQFVVSDSPVIRLEKFSPDGRFLALRNRSGLVFWDLELGEPRFITNGLVRLFSFASERPLLAIEEWGAQVSIWELPGMRQVASVQAEPDPPGNKSGGWSALALSPDGTLLAGARNQGNILELIEIEGERTRWRRTNAASIKSICWSPIRQRVATASTDGLVTFWRIDNGMVTARLRQPATGRSLAVNKTETLLAVASDDRNVRLWDLTTLRQAFSSPCNSSQIAFHKDGLRLGTVFLADQVGWLDLSRSSEFREFNIVRPSVDIETCQFSPDGRIIAGGMAEKIDLRNFTTTKQLAELPAGRMPIFCFDPQGHAVFTSDSKGVVRWPIRWTDGAGLEVGDREIILPGNGWRALTFRPDGAWFVAANVHSNTAFVFDRTLTNIFARMGPHRFVSAVALSPDGRWLATGSGWSRDFKVWDVQSGQPILTLTAGYKARATFSTDGKWLAVYGDKLDLRQVGSWQPAPPLPLSESAGLLGAAAFSPDSQLLAVIVDQQQVHLFDLVTWKRIGELRPPPAGPKMQALTFSPDGIRLAVACSNGRFRVWNLQALQQRLLEFGLDWELPKPF